LLVADPSWVTARHTWVEVLRRRPPGSGGAFAGVDGSGAV